MAQKLESHSQIIDALLGSMKKFIQMVVKKGERPSSRCRDNPAYAKKVASTLVDNWKIGHSVAALRCAEFHPILQPVAPLGHPNIEYLDERGDESDFHFSLSFLSLKSKRRSNLIGFMISRVPLMLWNTSTLIVVM